MPSSIFADTAGWGHLLDSSQPHHALAIAPHSWSDYPTPSNLPSVIVHDSALPLVSVVTPSFNQGRFIERTVASVLSQDYPNLEYWVIDGGSTDETISVLRSFEGDPRFHWLSERDRGQSDAVNKGWSRCRGAVLGWLNSDDTYLPGALRHLVGALQQHPGADAVYGDVAMITETDEVVLRLAGRPLDLHLLFRRNYINQPAALQRRAAVLRWGPLSLHHHFALDYEFYLKIALAGKLLYLPELCATYRLHTTSKTVSTRGPFIRDMYHVAAQLLLRSDVPASLVEQRAAILGEWHARMGLAYAQDRSLRESLRGMLMALERSPVQLKAYCIPIMAFDVLSGLQLTRRYLDVNYIRRTGKHIDDYIAA